MKTGLPIGEMAKEVQLNPKTIRYYEQVRLLPEPRRSDSRYRIYSGRDMERLRLIKRAKLLGLSLAQIKEIVEYAIDRRYGAVQGRLLSLVEAKLGEIDRKIEDLVNFRESLRQYHRELSLRLKPQIREGGNPPSPVSCDCIGKETVIQRK